MNVDVFFVSITFSVILLGESHDSPLFLLIVACYREPEQSQVTGMTDTLPGTWAERKCLEKGGASPKCNTKVLSCFCRTSVTFVHVNFVRCLR